MGPMSTTVDPKLSNFQTHPVSAPYGCRGLTWFHLQMKDRQRTPGSFSARRFYLLEMDQGGCEVWKTGIQPQISRNKERMVFLMIFFDSKQEFSWLLRPMSARYQHGAF